MTAVDPSLEKTARRAPTLPLSARSLPVLRRLTALVALTTFRRHRGGVTSEDLTLDGVPVRRYEPPSRAVAGPSPALIWIHGGGYLMGDHRENTVCSLYAAALGVPVFSVGYRLAPEYPFPAGLDDVVGAMAGLRSRRDTLVLDPDRLAVGGASAGGGLAASVAQRLHDEGLPPAAQLLIYPMLDDRTAVRDDIGPSDHKVWSNASNHFAWGAYLGTEPGAETQVDHAVPARRSDLTGLAPTWIGVGTLDLFLDESVAYADRLRGSGVACVLEVVEGGVHGFDLLFSAIDSGPARAFRRSQFDFLATHLGLAR